MTTAKQGDLIYCDPPYKDTQTILYGARSFSLDFLFQQIQRCKDRGVYVASTAPNALVISFVRSPF